MSIDHPSFRAEPVNPSRKPLTARQMQAYRLIADAWLSGQCATTRELGKALDGISINAVYCCVNALMRKGWVTRSPGPNAAWKSASRTLRPRTA